MPTIQPSGNIAVAINDIVGEYDQAINTVSEIAGALADASGALGAIGGGVQAVFAVFQAFFGLGSQADLVQAKLDAILNAIRTDFHKLNADLAADQILNRNTILKGFFDQAKTQLDALQAEINANPTPAQVVDFILPCIKALEDLGTGFAQNRDFAWNMNFDWQIYWTDAGQLQNNCVTEEYNFWFDAGYGLQAPDPNPDGATVFVYTYTLPLFLFAIDIFLAVAGSLDPNFVSNYRDSVLKPAVARLTSVFEKLFNEGLMKLSPPDWSDAWGVIRVFRNCTRAKGVRIARVHGGPTDLIEYGAIERFSGYSSIGTNYGINIPRPIPITPRSITIPLPGSINFNCVY